MTFWKTVGAVIVAQLIAVAFWTSFYGIMLLLISIPSK